MTIIADKITRQAVVFKKKTGCPKCTFLDMAINNSGYSGSIESIYLEDHSSEEFNDLGIMGTPVMAIVENGEIVEMDPSVIVGDQLAEFMTKL